MAMKNSTTDPNLIVTMRPPGKSFSLLSLNREPTTFTMTEMATTVVMLFPALEPAALALIASAAAGRVKGFRTLNLN
jgi:hypothetical protein